MAETQQQRHMGDARPAQVVANPAGRGLDRPTKDGFYDVRDSKPTKSVDTPREQLITNSAVFQYDTTGSPYFQNRSVDGGGLRARGGGAAGMEIPKRTRNM